MNTARRPAPAIGVGCTLAIVGATRGIEDHDTTSAKFTFQQALDFRVIFGLHLGVVIKIDDVGGVLDQREAFVVDRKIVREQPHVVDLNIDGIGFK
jgi:hypothetical protein